MILGRLPDEHDGDTSFLDWDTSVWTMVDWTLYDDFTLERTVRERS